MDVHHVMVSKCTSIAKSLTLYTIIKTLDHPLGSYSHLTRSLNLHRPQFLGIKTLLDIHI